MRNGSDPQRPSESSVRASLSDPARYVWDEFWKLSQRDQDLLMARMLAQIPMTLVVGGQGQGGDLTVYPRSDVTGILGDLVQRQTKS